MNDLLFGDSNQAIKVATTKQVNNLSQIACDMHTLSVPFHIHQLQDKIKRCIIHEGTESSYIILGLFIEDVSPRLP